MHEDVLMQTTRITYRFHYNSLFRVRIRLGIYLQVYYNSIFYIIQWM